MSDLRETVAQALAEKDGSELPEWYEDWADAAIAAARPTIERETIQRLVAEAENDKIPDSEGGWDIRYDVADWLREHLDDAQ